MREAAPAYYSERWRFYALTRHKDVVAAHRDWKTFSSAYGVTLDALSLRHGGTIPEGSPTLLVTGAATRDPRAYDRPDEFVIIRGGATTLAFGYGSHSCLGAWLARLESRVAFAQLRERWPRFEADTDGMRRVTMANVAGYSHIPVHVG